PGEFYQLDMEMSFVTQDDVFNAIGPVLHAVFEEFADGRKVSGSPFPRIPYRESMLKYGVDKPDLRNPLIISDVTDVFRGSGFSIFAKNIDKGSVVRAIPAPATGGQARSFFDKMNDWAREDMGAPGLGYITLDENGEGKGPIAKFLDAERLAKLKALSGIKPGDTAFFACGPELEAAKLAGAARIKLGNDLDLLEKNVFKFCWIVDFPYFEWDDKENKIIFSHNPFSMPQGGLEVLEKAKTKEDLLDILAYQYDIVCNGVELSSGAIRNHKPEIMYKAFEIAGYSKEVVDDRFRGMINAFKFGAPPHGGIAPGVDRIVMLLADEPNIREIIAFPMNQRAEDLLMNAPAAVDDKQLKELSLMLSPSARKSLEDEAKRKERGDNGEQQIAEDAA
ncbi:MAG: aspartate--tRNA ligase, partial [Alphaproteobacteria bacterium]|nr:aspartate--tRNA ligase [Alphaproteobacteria bacterium]